MVSVKAVPKVILAVFNNLDLCLHNIWEFHKCIGYPSPGKTPKRAKDPKLQ